MLLIGADGLDLAVLNQFFNENKLPAIHRIMEQGAYGVLFSGKPIRSPVVWMTIATGRPRQMHGIYDFITGSQYWPTRLRTEEQTFVFDLFRKTPGVTFRQADSKEAAKRYLERNPGLSFAAVADNEIIGCVMCGHDGPRGYLQHLVVKPAGVASPCIFVNNSIEES